MSTPEANMTQIARRMISAKAEQFTEFLAERLSLAQLQSHQ